MKEAVQYTLVLLLTWGVVFPTFSATTYLTNNDSLKALPEFDCLIEPSEIVDIGSPRHGIIDELYVERGDIVALDEPLAKLNSSVEEASLALAQAKANSMIEIELLHESAEFSKRLYTRNQDLFQKSVISSHELDRLETEHNLAQMQKLQAKSNNHLAHLELQRASKVLNERTIVSPIKGVVMERYKSAGEYVENEPLLRVVQLNPLRIEIFVKAEYWGRLLPGQKAEVLPQLSALGKQVATIERIDPVVDSASGTFRVQLELANPEYQIAAGLKCQLVFITDTPVEQSYDNNTAIAPVLPSTEPTVAKIVDAELPAIALTRTTAIAPFAETQPSLPELEPMFPKVTDNNHNTTSHALVFLWFKQLTAEQSSETLSPLIFPQNGNEKVNQYSSVQQDKPLLRNMPSKPQAKRLNFAQQADESHHNSCFAISPLTDSKIPAKLSQQLAGSNLALTVLPQSPLKVKNYQVHSLPLTEQRNIRLLLTQIKAAKIKNYFVTIDKETHARVFFYGAFKQQENAVNHVNTLKDKGFSVELTPSYQACETCSFKVSLFDEQKNSQVHELAREITPEQVLRNTLAKLAPQAKINLVDCNQLQVKLT